MGMTFTEEQKQVIDCRGKNLLVSAAAGSGKTAVLVERIIRILTDRDDPVDVDRLLIVTFTEAAAAEMKERIRGAIEKELENRPEDVHLQRQATLIHSALISMPVMAMPHTSIRSRRPVTPPMAMAHTGV